MNKIIKKINVFVDLLDRVYWDIDFKMRRYKHVFYMLVFAGFAGLLLYYWHSTTQSPTQSYTQATVNNAIVRMWTPDKMYMGEEYKRELELEVNAISLPNDTRITIFLSSPDENVVFSQKTISFLAEEKAANELNPVTFFYRNVVDPRSGFYVQAKIEIGEETSTFSRLIPLDIISQRLLLLLSAGFAGLLSIVSLINQVQNLRRKTDK
jgi:hypothetical protein